MDRRRHARTPANINAMLIGEKTVPKGCRVRNVSQQGMLLQCEPDGRLLTFSKGDTVEIHLSIEHAGEQQTLTIPSNVRHVNESHIYVEFHRPDPKLVELIESYRVSESHKLEASVAYAKTRPSPAKVTPISSQEKPGDRGRQQSTETKSGHKPFYFGLLTLILVCCILTAAYVYTAGINSRLNILETITENQSSELAEIRERVFSSSLQEGRYASLNARMTALGNAFASLEDKLTLIISRQQVTGLKSGSSTGESAQIIIRSQPAAKQQRAAAGLSVNEPVPDPSPLPVASATTGMATLQQTPSEPPALQPPASEDTPATSTQKQAAAEDNVQEQPTPGPAAEADSAVAAIEQTPPADKGISDRKPVTGDAGKPAEAAVKDKGITQSAIGKTATVARIDGPWVINLLSSRDKAYVERYASRASARDIPMELHSAKVKGRQYWRLQVTGFPTMAAARSASVDIKKKLGIKDVWIHKHK